MYRIVPSRQFKKDLKKIVRSGHFDLSLLNQIINALARGEVLDKKFKDRTLIGRMKGLRECHVKPDLLLVYSIRENELMLQLFRVGSHSDLFD
mgnify:FL=1